MLRILLRRGTASRRARGSERRCASGSRGWGLAEGALLLVADWGTESASAWGVQLLNGVGRLFRGVPDKLKDQVVFGFFVHFDGMFVDLASHAYDVAADDGGEIAARAGGRVEHRVGGWIVRLAVVGGTRSGGVAEACAACW